MYGITFQFFLGTYMFFKNILFEIKIHGDGFSKIWLPQKEL